MEYNFTIDDYIGGYPSNAKNIASKLKSLSGSPAHIKISSLGGSTMDALDIRRQFIEHGDITVYLIGGVASAATIPPQVLNSLGLPDMPERDTIVVNSSFTTINSILGLDNLPVREESILISEAQVGLIEQHILTLQTELADSASQVSDLQKQVANLLSSPGDDTPEVNTLATCADVSSYERVSQIFKSI